MALSSENHESLTEVVEFLFGDGAYETFSKELHGAAKDSAKRHKRQAQVGLASNVLGLAAGAQGLYAAEQDFNSKRRELKGLPPKEAGKIGRLKPVKAVADWAKKPKNALYLAGGAVALQGANVAGDMVANRVLSREADKKIKKSSPDGADLHVRGTLKQINQKDPRRKLTGETDKQGLVMPLSGQAVRFAANSAPQIKAGGQQVFDVAAPAAKKVKEKVSKSDEFDFRFDAEISKLDTDKRQVFGWASIVEKDGQPVVDLQGDYISVEEIEKAAYDYVQKSRKGGDMHRRNGDEPHHVSDMIESFIVTPEKKAAMGLPDSVPVGWWVGYQIHDDETWNLVKSGKRTGFSIHGRGKRKEL